MLSHFNLQIKARIRRLRSDEQFGDGGVLWCAVCRCSLAQMQDRLRHFRETLGAPAIGQLTLENELSHGRPTTGRT